MSIKTIKAQIANKIGTKVAQMKMGKPDITKGVYKNMTHLSENVKNPSFNTKVKAQDQQMKNANNTYKAERQAKMKNVVGSGSNGVQVGF